MAEKTWFLFCFGYQTAAQFNARWDDEDSQCVWILASNESDALDWGCEVAEDYVHQFCPTLPSWKSTNFAHSIATEASAAREWAETNAPRCESGKLPMWPIGTASIK